MGALNDFKPLKEAKSMCDSLAGAVLDRADSDPEADRSRVIRYLDHSKSSLESLEKKTGSALMDLNAQGAVDSHLFEMDEALDYIERLVKIFSLTPKLREIRAICTGLRLDISYGTRITRLNSHIRRIPEALPEIQGAMIKRARIELLQIKQKACPVKFHRELHSAEVGIALVRAS